MKEESSRGHRAAWLSHGFGIRRQEQHGLANLEFTDSYDVVHVFSDVFKIDGSDTLGAQSVGDGAGGIVGSGFGNLSGAKAGLSIGGEFGFDSDDVNGWVTKLDGSGDAAEHASAAARNEKSFEATHTSQ